MDHIIVLSYHLFTGSVCSFWKPTALLLGHSIVFWAEKYASESGWGRDLGLGDNINLLWSDHRGLRWPSLLDKVASCVHRHGAPSLLLIQLGENDLPQTTGRNLLQSISNDITTLRHRLPGTHLSWSCLLECIRWRGATSTEKVDLARRKVCKGACRITLSLGGSTVSHPEITHRIPALYRDDRVHLSEWGMDMWLHDIRAALHLWSQA